MKAKYRQYRESFKLKVVEEILRGKLTKEEARRKYKLKGKSGVLSWMRKFGVSTYNRLPTPSECMKEDEHSEKGRLLKRIQELERSLEDAQIKAEGYSRMIDIAERELKIKIRKKSSTKQSKK